MKTIIRLMLASLMAFCIVAAGMAIQMIPQAPSKAETSYADTTYTVFIYSGKEGYFGSPGNTVKKITGKAYNDTVTVSLGDLGLKLKHPDEYYVRGLKIAGHDNDELSSMELVSYTFKIKEDTSFSVAYGMAGGMVKYKVKYVSDKGKKLLDTETYYGMVGDKPVVSYKFIEDYLPQSYNLAKTLSEDESKNVFTFTYSKIEPQEVEENENGEGDENGNGNGNGNGNANNGANGNANGPNAGANGGIGTGGDDQGPADLVDLDDGDAPLTDFDDGKTPGAEDGSGGSGFPGWLIGLIIAAVLAIVAAIYALARRRRGEDAGEDVE